MHCLDSSGRYGRACWTITYIHIYHRYIFASIGLIILTSLSSPTSLTSVPSLTSLTSLSSFTSFLGARCISSTPCSYRPSLSTRGIERYGENSRSARASRLPKKARAMHLRCRAHTHRAYPKRLLRCTINVACAHRAYAKRHARCTISVATLSAMQGMQARHIQA